jgi:hypothetical protein
MTKRRERETDDAVPSKALSVLGPVPMLGNENVWVLVTVEPRTAACIADEEDSRRGEVDAAGAAGEVGKASRAEDTLEPDVSGIAEVVALNAVEDSGLHRLRPRRAFTNYFPEEAWFHSPSSPRKRRSRCSYQPYGFPGSRYCRFLGQSECLEQSSFSCHILIAYATC